MVKTNYFSVLMWPQTMIHFHRLKAWGRKVKNDPEVVGANINALFNNLLPAIATACEDSGFVRRGMLYVRMDFGDIPITNRAHLKERHEKQTANRTVRI